MKLSIIIPVYNEESTIKTLLNRIALVDLPIEKEIIIVDDGSTDNTRSILKRINRPGIKIYYHETNMGKGAAVRTGLRAASGDIVLIQDGDLEYDPMDYHELIKPIINKRARVVYGSRVLGRAPISYHRYYWGGRFLSFLANTLYGIKITDEPTCYKVMDATLIKGLDLRCRRFEFCAEVTAKLGRMGEDIVEVPISYTPRSIRDGKKIRWYDGLIAILILIRYRFWNPANEKAKSD
nr:glycosyltransferase family 2 protein [Desulfobacterales bacterium]